MSENNTPRWPQWVLHIREEVDFLSDISAKHSFEEFQDSKTLQHAVARSFQIMGEAVKRIPVETKDQYPFLPWKQMSGFRDVIVHDYYDLDIQMIWQVLVDIVPTLKTDILKIQLPQEI